ncbi:16S rRNA (cytidine(1402)-2'-O)-methyltransferase [[Mycoplasma] mobile]|uniref:Ribosomal RNA small subunit methyltransferase I n=1 Tax=Mycoplasma mobile (strain ATCC 43663 / 163K / NCTC 11711) TaxID=267748 RepID=Q6KHB9_MYCM1|nr:16S rRNA (cytidine(1402)-2'-O)-methyltransferase [[Mycoplasma] mobile]AAT28011.1 putative SAM-dependent methyltransferase [Mycoplasma mobile 163K]
METKFFIVGTPIGNLEDITLRALRILKEVDVIACEDTRESQKLLNYFEIIGKKLISYHDKNEINSAKGIISLIQNENKSVALISDAGMPILSDPGFRVLKLVRENNIKYELIPGVSAITSTAVLSGFDTHFTFLGFFKDKTIQRQNHLKKLIPGSYVAFVSPHKLMSVLKDLEFVFGNFLQIFVGKELTKKFEEHFFGNVSEIYKIFEKKDSIKGEYTIAFEFKNFALNKDLVK